MEGRKALENADRIVGTLRTVTAEPSQIRFVRPAMAASTMSGLGHRKVGAVMLADAKRVDADLVSQHALFDDVANDVGMGYAGWASGPVVMSPKVSKPSSICRAIISLLILIPPLTRAKPRLTHYCQLGQLSFGVASQHLNMCEAVNGGLP